MIEVDRFVGCLLDAGVEFFTGVPDSLLKSFCAYVTDNCGESHVIAANEGGAVGLAAGHYLATGRPALVYMQNSGQGNAVNPLASLADPDVYSIPMVLLVGWRGEPGVRDEPQHVKQGKVTISLFGTLGIPTEVLPADEHAALELTRKMLELARAESRPVALIVRKGLFAEYRLQKKEDDIAELKREAAIEGILGALPEDAVVVSTTGMISREVYETRERLGQGHERDFLTVGSMGHAVMIARCESLITGAGEDDAVSRCRAYCEAGADGIMIHSRAKTPDEVVGFVKRFRAEVSADKPIVVMPSTYSQVKEAELAAVGVNIVIYANQLLRAAYPAMRRAAERILECERAQEASAEFCMPIGEIISLI